MAEHNKPDLEKEDIEDYILKIMDILSLPYLQLRTKENLAKIIKEIWDDAQSK